MKPKHNEARPDYYILFIMGIIFTGAGVAMGFFPMMALGLIFMFIGGLNRAKWMRPKSE